LRLKWAITGQPSASWARTAICFVVRVHSARRHGDTNEVDNDREASRDMRVVQHFDCASRSHSIGPRQRNPVQGYYCAQSRPTGSDPGAHDCRVKPFQLANWSYVAPDSKTSRSAAAATGASSGLATRPSKMQQGCRGYLGNHRSIATGSERLRCSGGLLDETRAAGSDAIHKRVLILVESKQVIGQSAGKLNGASDVVSYGETVGRARRAVS